ncbi:UNVERIFIED_CONTAM: Retrovirus-related Pol polyprotein from transposon TNT 1-94 [Sesamum latifolium]|uniref:Retrovirus-related Pol polyprotein from transposon TNT 1-94 n=1 Tax=Sesamum latifolium TaxID=2727402 RepID=A0AAW2WDK6_9LAMI
MTNEIQKQYDRFEDVPSIILRMKVFMRFLTGILDTPREKHSSGPRCPKDREASTSKVKGKGARRWKRKKGKGTAVTATVSTGGAPPAAPKGKGKGKVGILSGRRQMMCASIAKERGIGRGSVHNSSPTQVLERSRRLSKNEMILKLGDGKAIVAEAVGSLHLVSEAFGRFKEYRLEVENQTNRKIKALRSDRGGEYLSGLSDIRKKLRDTISMIGRAKDLCLGNAVFLEKDFSSDSRHDEVLIDESSGEPQHDNTTSFEPTVYTDGAPILRRSTRKSRIPERYGFVGLTINWITIQRHPPKGIRPVGCKWVYKHKLGADGEVTAFKARLVAKGYTRRPGVDFEETYSPMAMAKSIRILLAIAAWSIYGLNQAFRSWNTRFDEVIRGYDFTKNDYDPCIYKKISGSSVAYLVLYIDDILLIENDVKMLGDIKTWLSTQFSMKDMGEVSYIVGIKIRRMLGLTQSSYIEKVLKRFKMEHSKRGLLPMRHGIKLSKKQSLKTDEELKRMSNIPHASAIGSIQYAVQCTKPDVAYALSVTSRYQACAGEVHWGVVQFLTCFN